MNIYKFVNELRKVNRGVEFRISDNLFMGKNHIRIFTPVKVEDINMPDGFTSGENCIYVNGYKIDVVDILEMLPGTAYPDVDVHKDTFTHDTVAMLLQEINPESVIVQGEKDGVIYIDDNLKNIALPIGFELEDGVLVSKACSDLKILKYNEEDNISYKKTSYNKLKARKISYLKDSKRVMSDPKTPEHIKKFSAVDYESYKKLNINVKSDFLVLSELERTLGLEKEERNDLDNYLDKTYLDFYKSIYAEIERNTAVGKIFNDTASVAFALAVLAVVLRNEDIKLFIHDNIDAFTSSKEFLNFINDLGFTGVATFFTTLALKRDAIVTEIKKKELNKNLKTLNEAVEFDLQKDFFVRKKNKK
ncbi:MAG: hypothetical protein R3Y13_02005 [bacterium]